VSSKDNPVKSPQTCPGLRDFLRPTVAYVKCHVCGGNVEIWSDEDVGTCNDCGAEWRRPDKNSSCLDHCEFADKCRALISERKP
jgi:hypothetical protein